jgi:hypothetical protein
MLIAVSFSAPAVASFALNVAQPLRQPLRSQVVEGQRHDIGFRQQVALSAGNDLPAFFDVVGFEDPALRLK